MKTIDNQFELTTIKSVSGETPNWTFERADGWSFGFTHKSIVPKVGDMVGFYGKGTGYIVRGLFVDGKKVFYRTEKQQDALFKRQIAADERKRKLAFTKNRKKYEARISALPTEFRNRIDGFRTRNKKFNADHLPYELFTCEQSVAFAKALKTVDEITRFHKLDYADQKKLVPAMDDGHSGNTFGAACVLARLYLEQPELIAKMHGALCPLVGCKDYGCYAATVKQSSPCACQASHRHRTSAPTPQRKPC